MQEIFDTWKKDHSDVVKINWIYVIAGVVLVVLAGLVALLNRDAAQVVVGVAGTAFLVFLVNTVTWSLIGPFLSAKSSSRRK